MALNDLRKDDALGLHIETLDHPLKSDISQDVPIENRDLKERRLVRRIDVRMMPLMMLLYKFIQIFHSGALTNMVTEKNHPNCDQIATARLGNFEKDIGLVGTQYNTIISVFFVGYILTQVPTNMILNKMRPSIFLPVVMCCWAVASASTGAVQNYKGAVVLRFLLGFVEAPFFPGALYLFSSWYTKKELAVRFSVLYAAGQMAGAFGGLLGSAIMGGMNGKLGLADWRWLFIIEGTIPIPVAIVTYLTLPDYPATTKWLTDEERKLAILRITEEAVEEDNREEASALQGLKMTFTDPALYMIWLMQLGLNTAAAFTNFFPTISHSPQYWQANIINVAFSGMCILLATSLHFYLRWRNRKLRVAGDKDLQNEGTRLGSRSTKLGEKWQCHPAYQYTL
ncbi:hypothetical protein CCUS01_03940 [Colletotrichum cuscutae]|uniref:Major facilitator superfamily (MFS) profile domain-containing protein n=1 Tax=Colletotrichum cuscutae TaxID=1209917 RepID=A0AAI9VDG8_9PEZI|nr:hypothetical protein CCUS01_03940 [Colletotrichum cuscutae]